MGLIGFFSDKERVSVAAMGVLLLVMFVGLVNKVMLRRFALRPPSSELYKLLFTKVGDGGSRQVNSSSGLGLFLSILSIGSLLAAIGGLVLCVLVLAGAFDPPKLKSYAAAAGALLFVGLAGIYYSGKSRGWPGR